MNKQIIITIVLIAVFLTFTINVFGGSLQGYHVSKYDVSVDIKRDGTLDITEHVEFSFLGNSNNAVFIIDKHDDEEIEIKHVYIHMNNQMIECERLSAGQWDANVFNGTYSEIKENNIVRLKIYGVFKRQRAKVLVQYSVKNAIKRYKDIAVYNRKHVQKFWDGYISNMNINIRLPRPVATEKVSVYLHGVIIGHKQVYEGSRVHYSIPNTVPGEYVECRILFPEFLVNEAARTSEERMLESILEEEKEYNESDKSELLRARENAAKEEGRRAYDEQLKQKIKITSVIISVLTSIFGLVFVSRINRSLSANNGQLDFGIEDIPSLSPIESQLLIRGRIGARGILGGVFQLVSRGFIDFDIVNGVLCFTCRDDVDLAVLKSSERKLMDLVKTMRHEKFSFCPAKLLNNKQKYVDIADLRILFIEWDRAVRRELAEKNLLSEEQQFYRNLGFIVGAIIFAAGCIIPVATSIWSGYIMIIVGLILFVFSLDAYRKTSYSIIRVRELKKLGRLIKGKNKSNTDMPKWAVDVDLLLGYALVLGVENNLFFKKQPKHEISKNMLDDALKGTHQLLHDYLEL